MPLYEYECDECHHRFELIRKYSDPPVTACTQCGGVVRKLLSSPAIQFKGSGWYITDYARKDSSGAPGSKTGDKADGKAEGKAESSGESSASTADGSKESGSKSSPSTSSSTSPAATSGPSSGSTTKNA